MKVSFFTLGCKVNQYETEALKEQFIREGFDVVGSQTEDSEESSPDMADIYVINTCTVTNLADRKSRQFIRRAKAKNPQGIIAVTGCYAQVDPEAVANIHGVNIIAGTNEKQNLIEYIKEYIHDHSESGASEDSQKALDSNIHIKSYEELCEYQSNGIITAMDSRTRAYIKIQEGCNRFCTYCIIPFARGKIRSRKEEEIIQEVKGLVDKGFKEIVLTGINTALYGEDNGLGLAGLLKQIDLIPGDFRIRLSSLEPTVVSKDDVISILDSERLCHHLHLSIQSGSDNVLKAMGRNYNRKEYLEIVEILREKDPHFGITTDIIVGFPGETDEDFMDSLDVVEKAGFSKVHEFRYSPREGTKAATFPNQIHGDIKKSRLEELSEVAEKVSKKFCEEMIGVPQKVLLEEIVDIDGEKMAVGYTDNYVRVFIPQAQGADKLNEFVEIIPLSVYNGGTKGELSNE